MFVSSALVPAGVGRYGRHVGFLSVLGGERIALFLFVLCFVSFGVRTARVRLGAFRVSALVAILALLSGRPVAVWVEAIASMVVVALGSAFSFAFAFAFAFTFVVLAPAAAVVAAAASVAFSKS